MKLENICLTLPILGVIIEILYFAQSFDNNWRIVTIGSTALIALPTLFAILRPANSKTCLAMIVVSSFFVQIMYFLSFKDFSYVPPRDAAYHLQVVNLILVRGSVPFGEGVGQALTYSYYPGMHILFSEISLITSLNPVFLVKLSPLLYVTIPVALYVLTKLLTKQTIAAGLAAFIFIFVPYGAYVPKYNFLALAFFLFLLLSLSLYQVRGRINLLVSSLLFALALSITHHLTSYILLVFLTTILLLSLIPRKSKWKIDWSPWNPIKWHVLALILLVITWPLFVGFQVLSNQAYVFWDLIGKLESGQERSIPFLTGTYSAPESYFIFASLALLLLLGLAGFIYYLRDRNSNSTLILTVILFGLLFLAAYSLRNLTELLEELSLRSWSFLFLGIAPMIGYIAAKIRQPSSAPSMIRFSKLAKLKMKYVSALVIFLIISCYVFSGVDLIPRPYYDFNEEKESGFSSSLRGYGEKVAASIMWYNATKSSDLKAIGDGIVKDMSAPFALEIDSRYDFYYTPTAYRDILSGKGYIFIDYSFALYGQTPEWKVVMTKTNLENVTQVASSGKDLVKIYDNGLISTLFKER